MAGKLCSTSEQQFQKLRSKDLGPEDGGKENEVARELLTEPLSAKEVHLAECVEAFACAREGEWIV